MLIYYISFTVFFTEHSIQIAYKLKVRYTNLSGQKETSLRIFMATLSFKAYVKKNQLVFSVDMPEVDTSHIPALFHTGNSADVPTSGVVIMPR